MEWRDKPTMSMGVWERPFSVTRDGDRIPGILWMPEEPQGAVPLVLLGHGRDHVSGFAARSLHVRPL